MPAYISTSAPTATRCFAPKKETAACSAPLVLYPVHRFNSKAGKKDAASSRIYMIKSDMPLYYEPFLSSNPRYIAETITKENRNMAQDIWINLPVKDLSKAVKFFTELGFKHQSGPGNSE